MHARQDEDERDQRLHVTHRHLRHLAAEGRCRRRWHELDILNWVSNGDVDLGRRRRVSGTLHLPESRELAHKPHQIQQKPPNTQTHPNLLVFDFRLPCIKVSKSNRSKIQCIMPRTDPYSEDTIQYTTEYTTECTTECTTEYMEQSEKLVELEVPNPTKQALMMMKGVEIFLEPSMAADIGCLSGQTAFGTSPPYIESVIHSAKLPHKPRLPKDMHDMVTMVPKDAILLTILLDVSGQVYICDYVLEKQDNDDKDEDSIQQNWWKASAYALQNFYFNRVLSANSVVHAWLHFNRQNQITLGVFDISTDNRGPMQHMNIVRRSGHLHKMFCDAVKLHGNVGQLSWVWVGELGHDGEIVSAPAPACGACAVILQNSWCFDIDYLLKFPHDKQQNEKNSLHELTHELTYEPKYELVQATHPNHSDTLKSPPRKRFKTLSVEIPLR